VGEVLEQPVAQPGRDAGAVVQHLGPQQSPRRLPGEPQPHLAATAEGDRIVQQAAEDLAQPPLIGAEARRQSRGVRISWLAAPRNRLLASLAAVAASRAVKRHSRSGVSDALGKPVTSKAAIVRRRAASGGGSTSRRPSSAFVIRGLEPQKASRSSSGRMAFRR
jgi:hypothetical protein